jgi:transposase
LEGETKLKIPKQEHTGAFKKMAVKQVTAVQGISPVTREPGLVKQTRRNWVKALTPENMELSQLRVENIELQRQRKTQKKQRRTSPRTGYEVRLDGRVSHGIRMGRTMQGAVPRLYNLIAHVKGPARLPQLAPPPWRE